MVSPKENTHSCSLTVRAGTWRGALVLVFSFLLFSSVPVVADSVINGIFDGNSGWTDHIELWDGAIEYPNLLIVTGPNNGSGQAKSNYAFQTINVSAGSLEFDLYSYTSTDTGNYDYPIFYLDGVLFALYDDGTTDGSKGGLQINNAHAVWDVHFVRELESGSHTIGFGIFSVDSIFGAGIGIFDNVTYHEIPVLSIDLNTNAWNIGSLPLGSVCGTWTGDGGRFVVSNSGTVSADVYIQVTNSVNSGWIPAAAPGSNRFRMGFCAAWNKPAPEYVAISPQSRQMGGALARNQSMGFDLEFWAPKSAETHIPNSIRVTLTAIEAEQQ